MTKSFSSNCPRIPRQLRFGQSGLEGVAWRGGGRRMCVEGGGDGVVVVGCVRFVAITIHGRREP